MDDYSGWARRLEQEFQARSGLAGRRYYKLFYSHLHPFPLLVLGYNPGGETDGTDLNASEGVYEHWEHDYVRFRNTPRYKLARPMYELLTWCLGSESSNIVRQVPVTNVIFRRSRNTGRLTLSERDAVAESQPYLEEMLRVVDPRIILLVSNGAYKLFAKEYCTHLRVDPDSQVSTPNGRHRASLYRAANARLTVAGRDVRLVCVAHPSKYAGRQEWRTARDLLRDEFKRADLNPIEGTPYLYPVDSLR